LENQINSLTEYKNFLEKENENLRQGLKKAPKETSSESNDISNMELESIILEFAQTEDPQRKEYLKKEIIKMGLDPAMYDP
jgi:hypothetical protein